MSFKTIVGLEIHVQLMTKTKAFCSCRADVFDLPPNTAICPVCTGQPGALPTVNSTMIDYAIKIALALNCNIHEYSRFDRKNYFYPDLPKGYQITQYFYPIATSGYMDIDVDGQTKRIRIRRLHIEEDAGKLIHEGDSITQAQYSLVDMNRCGVPLVEIVTEPDLSSPKEARIFVEKLRSILRYLEVSSGDMEKGALRCDANISIYDESAHLQSNRVEVKNMNSFRFIEKALEYEQQRIIEALKNNEDVEKETRGWDIATKMTVSMRGKEEESDYRYFPEPDIPPVIVPVERIEEIKRSLVELPDEKIERFVSVYGIPKYDATVLAMNKEIADFYEACVREIDKPKEISNWIMTEMLREMKSLESENITITPAHLCELFRLMEKGEISMKIAKEVFPTVFRTGKMPGEIIKERGLKQISDENLLENIVKKVLEDNPKAVEQYKSGKTGVIGFFVGQVMKETKGAANPQVVNKIIKQILG
ncbi:MULTISPECIES: Asp-tRNA(Asn)/Glu-tRNA(Gln) amidotransferase subunit GatB [Pseudothermotoga]|jgi:aspartyl-tRNA(Asn)/glutamyl-tRNA(Gln) amidotransferase subunit B|uniref:Aspartyl/glutamyl-tRNA(Asn/Gln) amidotransferase subunit B n=1 Tax=Pseudothermotoga lettingae (strain ATCC BAA-301 / DSM 14385 / NBRC 107922 / TMO) TaxID=416591 RepID=GATB_PSELT|nr:MULTISPECIES: Asp-tRNA(Asn)/Glu-tRNA(Gln) amidotransferase subunit GatB [Pseudothermotoga]A8F5H5.1 RecName: Full=Aspartyl/glutamyl-tRNA(Asn/Gln) amidotransferase subunit B; Short=Asp/Glu-ADT subunit B [Pseudothermotoga lettingae TMO]ABV33409.1 glutamyl-tRNA(Gln) amidotransferase, B subunit [Pseudothermotoga lettingae TMO]MDK2884420.1 aspartyl-tRNA(Asn)/glutamyl-tRNA(Gln) amidotransferase subunit [Pseudothermotoga sp.]GLI49677.1 aspartyl/glutamyl-tRNA(Asn/Gln) amidotransferase subunit B [Pseu